MSRPTSYWFHVYDRPFRVTQSGLREFCERAVVDPSSPGPWIADSTHRGSTAQDGHRKTP